MERNSEAKKVVLVSTGSSQGEFTQFSRFLPTTTVGLHYIAAALRGDQFEVNIVNQTNDCLSKDEVVQRIQAANPDYVLLSQFFTTRDYIRGLIYEVLSGYSEGGENAPVFLVGGHDATFHSVVEEDLNGQYRNIDYVVQGEAEAGFSDQLANMRKQTSPVLVNNLGSRVEDMDALPILKHDDYSGDVGFLSTSRGCYKLGCDFCTTPSFYPDGWRERSPEHVTQELENLYAAGKRYLFVCDDNFLGFTEEHLRRGHEIIMQCKRLGLKIMIMTIKEQVLRAEKLGLISEWQGTVYRCFLGIESGGSSIGDKLGKRVGAKGHAMRSQHVMKTLYGNGIAVMLGWMSFKPDSTFEELEEDVRFLYENCAEAAVFTNLSQSLRFYEGTKMYDRHKDRNPRQVDGEFDYDFDDGAVGDFYRFLMFEVRDENVELLDNLMFEVADIIYITQKQDSPIGREYWDLKRSLNESYYRFFMDCLKVFQGGEDRQALVALKAEIRVVVSNFIFSAKEIRSRLGDEM